MRCERCGAPVTEDQRFCPSCGMEIERKANDPQRSAMTQPAAAVIPPAVMIAPETTAPAEMFAAPPETWSALSVVPSPKGSPSTVFAYL